MLADVHVFRRKNGLYPPTNSGIPIQEIVKFVLFGDVNVIFHKKSPGCKTWALAYSAKFVDPLNGYVYLIAVVGFMDSAAVLSGESALGDGWLNVIAHRFGVFTHCFHHATSPEAAEIKDDLIAFECEDRLVIHAALSPLRGLLHMLSSTDLHVSGSRWLDHQLNPNRVYAPSQDSNTPA